MNRYIFSTKHANDVNSFQPLQNPFNYLGPFAILFEKNLMKALKNLLAYHISAFAYRAAYKSFNRIHYRPVDFHQNKYEQDCTARSAVKAFRKKTQHCLAGCVRSFERCDRADMIVTLFSVRIVSQWGLVLGIIIFTQF